MSQLNLEFVRVRRIPWFGVIFLIVSLACLAFAFAEVVRLQNANEQRRERIAELERTLEKRQKEQKMAHAREEAAYAPQRKEYDDMRAALDYPWNRLFAGIEQASNKEVALLSMGHDRVAGTTHIVAESLDLPAMAQFVERLNGEEGGRWYIASYRLQAQKSPPTIIGEITQR